MASRGGTPAPRRSVGMKDVAIHAGVSLGTVSNVLNHPERVSESSRLRVQAAIHELGFIRNESARQLRAGRSQLVAYLVLDIANPFFADVALGVEEAIQEAGLGLVLCNSNEDPQLERRYAELMEQQRVRGMLVTPANGDDAALRRLPQRGTPLVYVDRVVPDHHGCSVAVDDVLGGRLAASHLIELGHRRIAFVGGPPDLPQVVDRRSGARAAMADAGLPDNALVDIETRSLSFAAGRSAGEQLLGLPVGHRPTAAFCANDLVALGLLQHTIATGRSVPQDLAIVGYDDIDFAGAAAVPLTSVRQPRHKIGRIAARLVLDESANPDHQHERVVFKPYLVVRASTNRVAHAAPPSASS